MNRSLKLGLTSAALIIIASQTVPAASAFWPFDGLKTTEQSSTSTTTAPPTLLETLIKKFGLNQEQVNTAVNEYRADRQKEMQARFEAQLTQAVKDGKLTENQKQLLIAKHQELRAEQQAQFQARQQKHTELEAWAKENNIDISFLVPQYGQGGQGGMMGEGRRGGGMGRGMMYQNE